MLHIFQQRFLPLSAGVLIIAVVLVTPAAAECDFTTLQANLDKTGRVLTVLPSLAQCSSVPSSLTLSAFNFSSVLNHTDVRYVSGQQRILVNGSSVAPGSTIASARIQDTKTITFNATGDYIFQASGGGMTSTNITVRVSQFALQPGRLPLATGGVAPNSNLLVVQTQLSWKPRFSSALLRNDGGESASTLKMDNSASAGRALVSATPQGSSGVFQVTASALSSTAAASQVTVPPQSLIQILMGEAGSQDGMAKAGVAIVVRNRVRNPQYNFGQGSRPTYRSVIYAAGQFASINSSLFINSVNRSSASQAKYDESLSVASDIFDNAQQATLRNAIAFGSPGAVLTGQALADELNRLQTNIARCPKVDSKTLGFNSRWFPRLSSIDTQAVVVSGIPASTFVFLRPRFNNECAVVAVSSFAQ